MKKYNHGETLYCPACNKLPDGEDLPVEDYVVPNSDAGSVCETECGHCYALFVVETLEKNSRYVAYLDN